MESEGKARPHSSPHDSFIKAIARHKEAAAGLLSLLPPQITNGVTIADVTLESGTYVDEQLASTHSDLLFSCRFKGRPGFLYFLLEHQTRAEWKMPFRMADYTMRILKDWQKLNPAAKKFPAIV